MNLTIVIPSYNNLEYLKLCYTSIRAASKDVPLVLIDDGSSDGTAEYLTEIATNDRNTKTSISEERLGHTYWYDAGFRYARTEYVGIMHSDMVVPPNFFEVLLPLLNPDNVVSAKCIEPPLHPPGAEKIVKDFGMYPNDFKSAAFNAFVVGESQQKKGQTMPALFAPWFINVKQYFDRIGGHDRQFAPYGWEDADLFVRMMRAGFTPVQAQDLLVYHFTQRGHRWSNGNVGKAHDDYQLQMHITRNRFATKWGTLQWKNELHTPANIPLYYKQLRIKNYEHSMDARIRYEPLQLFFNRIVSDEGHLMKADGLSLEPNYEITFDYKLLYDMNELITLIQQMPFIVAEYEPGEYEISTGITINIFNTKQIGE